MYTVESFSVHSQGCVWKEVFQGLSDVYCLLPGWVHEN